MVTAIVERWCTKRGGWQAGLEKRVGRDVLRLEVVPRKGELLTVHPRGAVSDSSWSGEVTSVQHVVSQDHTVVLIVMDVTEAARELPAVGSGR